MNPTLMWITRTSIITLASKVSAPALPYFDITFKAGHRGGRRLERRGTFRGGS
jgi:hypothetical protein